MVEQCVVLVTGVAGYWGGRVARRLLGEPGYRVLGLDNEPPQAESRRHSSAIEGLDFVPADVRNPLLGELLETAGVDIVCHLAFVETVRPSQAAFDLNVTGTVQLLEACAQAGVRKVVLKSSTAVYGARPDNPAFLSEDRALRGSRKYGYTRDRVEIETFCASFRQRQPGLQLTILRLANVVGPTADTPLTRFLREPRAPTLLGFDPLMQLIHEDDAVAALVHAVGHHAVGTYNVAAEDRLPLNKIRGLVGKPPFSVLHPLAYRGGRWLRRAGLNPDRYLPLEPDYLRYPWVGDLERMRDELGFVPRFSAEEALAALAEAQHRGRLGPGPIGLARDEERLRAMIAQRRQASAEEGDDD
jgi:UDP-glucose 4-epimerase